jgi:hypothetical protein
MGLFKKAENQQGYLKMGFMGFPGSGKTFTATEVAIGLVKLLKDKRPVFALDTEKGLDYVVEKFTAAGIELQIARTRAFVDLLEAVDEAEKNGALLFIDSITHFWEEVQESYKKANQRQRLTFADWGPIKSTWKRYTEKFLNSKVHIIMCGRAADTFDYFENPDDKKMELHKTGTKMQAEKNLGYEPGIAVEMERANVGDLKAGQRTIINRAYILKDRFDMLDGMVFDNPTFDTFLPHIKKLNIGVHEGLSGTNSTELFDKDSDKNWLEAKKQVEILKEEIQGILTSYFPGQSSEEKKIKTDIVFEAFGTRSWIALDDMTPDQLKKGIVAIKAKAEMLKASFKGGKLNAA